MTVFSDLTSPLGATTVPSLTRQSLSKTCHAASLWTVETTPRWGIMKTLSWYIMVTPSGWKASFRIMRDWILLGAWDRSPPVPATISMFIMSM